MNYFQPYSPSFDETIVAAWDSQVAGGESSWFEDIPVNRRAEVFARFAARYAELRALPRHARRGLQRRLARSSDIASVSPDRRRKLASSLAGAALLLALGQGIAEASDIFVAAKIAPGILDGDHQCSLIEAIENANDTFDGQPHVDCLAAEPLAPNRIVLPAKSTQTLSAISDSTYGGTGLPLITSQITIQGNGAKIVRSTKGAPPFRLIAVAATGDLTLQNVTLTGGSAPYNYGGAIFNYGSLAITNSIISKNSALLGGAVYNSAALGPGYGVLSITGSTVTGNLATYGGGVVNYSGTLTINGGTISKNTAKFNPLYGVGGIGGGVLTSYGENDSINNCVITGNIAAYGGGGIFSVSYLTITGGTISKNSSAGALAGGSLSGGKGGGIYNSGTLTINSTVTGNKGRYGGGVFNSGTIYLTSGGVTKNSATVHGGGVYNAGSLDNPALVIGNKGPKGEDPNIFSSP